MHGINACLTIFMAEQGESLLQQIEGIRNGDADAIHDARVATRRIRAALSLVAGNGHQACQAVDQQMRSLTRALGTARDLDVIAGLIARARHDDRSAGGALDPFTRTIHTERDHARRTLIKALEAMPLHAIVPTDRKLGARWWPAQRNVASELDTQLRRESAALLDSVEHASGVYFPKRTHAVRVHTKRLRYLVELAMRAGRWRSDREATVLARVQSLLGDLHDRELLLQRLSQLNDATAFGALRDAAVAERDELFDQYLALRDRLRRASTTIHSATGATRPRWSLIATAVAVPSALVAGLIAIERRRTTRARTEPSVARPARELSPVMRPNTAGTPASVTPK
jgi:CHAD domain-containing protein